MWDGRYVYRGFDPSFLDDAKTKASEDWGDYNFEDKKA